MTLIKKTGEKILLKAADVRARLGLRSTAFKLGVLRVGRPPATSPAGRPVVVSGLARDVQAPLLQKLAANGTLGSRPSRWRPTDDGSFAVTVRPKATATYRLTADGQVGPALTITVPAGPAK